MTNHDGSRERQRALEAEIRIGIDRTGQAPWVEHPEEARRWVYDIAQDVFGEALDGVVEMGRSYMEMDTFVQFLHVDAAATAANREIVQSEARNLADRLAHDLAIRFSVVGSTTRPIVTFDVDHNFLAGASLSGRKGARPELSSSPSPAHAPRPRFMSASPWLSAALGGALIAVGFLTWRVIDLDASDAEAKRLREENARLTYELRISTSARSYEAGECTKSINAHRLMIANLAARCSPKQPTPKPPALPRPYPEGAMMPGPYPETPDPFAPRQ